MDTMDGLVRALMGGFVGQKKGRSDFGTRQRVSAELTVVTHQSTPGRMKYLGFHSRLMVQVGRLGEWMEERTMSRRGIQRHTLT